MKARVLLPLLLAAACSTPQPRYLVGEAYSLGGVWSYPREDFTLVETGLATRQAGPGWNTPTANGEAWSSSRALAAHRTLQLPAVVTVTNLENGSSLTLRVNDRGPVNPGRVIGLSDRAADLLGIPPGGAAQVRVAVDGDRSRALGEGVLGRPPEAIAIEAAPRAAVASESLAPPPGARDAGQRSVAVPVTASAAPVAASAPAQVVLPETVTPGMPNPGRIFVEAGILSRADAAQRLAARIPGARVEAFGPRRDQRYRVRVGPFSTAAQADATLERTLAAGVSGARILVD
ncbi:RlpA-like double-psi beta-barrel domain-containing protein [Roseomonas sp. CAU 1739]|uniref:septal ring lytic transglycosylase RlpA family protein n=1 Tax=Roseomonas sp. CAU 1739 TaxID=3140364 RepID=UPI00325ADDD5